MTKLELLHPQVAAAIKEHGLDVEVLECDPQFADTVAFCEQYKIAPEQTCNAIIVVGKSNPVRYVCGVTLATCKLDVNKAVSGLLQIKRCSFATAEQTLDATSMEIGGVTPIGVSSIPIYINSRIMECEKIVLGGGNRSSKLLIKPSELKKLPNLQVINDLAVPRFEAGC